MNKYFGQFLLGLAAALALLAILTTLLLATMPRTHNSALRCIKGVSCRTAQPAAGDRAALRRALLRLR
jgi:hypothetical protein